MQRLTNKKGETDNNTIMVWHLTSHIHQWIDHPERKSVWQHWSSMTDQSSWTQRYTGHFIPKHQNTYSFQMHKETSPEQITCWATEQLLTNFKGIEMIKYFLTTNEVRNQLQEENWESTWKVVFPFSFVSRYFLISSLFSSLIYFLSEHAGKSIARFIKK